VIYGCDGYQVFADGFAGASVSRDELQADTREREGALGCGGGVGAKKGARVQMMSGTNAVDIAICDEVKEAEKKTAALAEKVEALTLGIRSLTEASSDIQKRLVTLRKHINESLEEAKYVYSEEKQALECIQYIETALQFKQYKTGNCMCQICAEAQNPS
jgi:chromosome segregation ATPase